MRFVIAPNERTAVLGRSGSGKTVLSRLLVQGYRQLVAVDPKHRLDLPGVPVVYGAAEFRNTYPQRATRLIFRPDPTSDASLWSDVDEALQRVYRYGRTAVLVDESVDVASKARIVPAYRRLIRLGRELLIPVFSVSQRPRDLHNDILGNVEHLFVFDLPLQTDRKKAAEMAGDELLTRADEHFGTEHGFAYSGPGTRGAVVWCPPLSLTPAQLPRPAVTNQPEGNTGNGAS